jgi:hypothetical protein
MKVRLTLIPILLSLLVISCAPKSITTDPGKSAWYANQVAIRVNELSRTAIQLNSTGVLTDKDTRTIGVWAVTALKTLGAASAGWEKSVLLGWEEMKKNLPESVLTNPTLALSFSVIDSLLTLLNPPGEELWQ